MIHLLLFAGDTGDKLDIVSLIVHAGAIPKAVLGLLAVMSAISWFVIGSKWMYLSRANRRSLHFVARFCGGNLG